ncbi:hypothetical protein RJT34_20386 [Clitoria ternatea]|uniref:Uncharacterized protein n=1 Tax=Clitoria ternatea TaxID=43366 RepID=A0AAN9ISQ7_CLITE
MMDDYGSLYSFLLIGHLSSSLSLSLSLSLFIASSATLSSPIPFFLLISLSHTNHHHTPEISESSLLIWVGLIFCGLLWNLYSVI